MWNLIMNWLEFIQFICMFLFFADLKHFNKPENYTQPIQRAFSGLWGGYFIVILISVAGNMAHLPGNIVSIGRLVILAIIVILTVFILIRLWGHTFTRRERNLYYGAIAALILLVPASLLNFFA